MRVQVWFLVLLCLSITRAVEACERPHWPPNLTPVVRLQPGDIRALAEVIFGEARGDDWCSMIAVGSVVINRLRADPKSWGATIAQVTNKPGQFSSFGKLDPNYKAMKKADDSDVAFFVAQMAALAVLQGAPDPTGGATYFHHYSILPRWAPGLQRTARIGSHFFYKAKP